MFLYVYLFLAVAAIVAALIARERNYDNDFAFLAVVASIVGFIIYLIVGTLPLAGSQTTTVERPLVALGVSDSTSGSFYLGGGYAEGQKELSFIEQHSSEDETWSVVDSVGAHHSRIFEDDSEPRVEIHTKNWSNYMMIPWSTIRITTYDFYVPAGSVKSDYTVDVK